MTATHQRYRDWQSRLAAHLAEREHAPFSWGSNDCALFVCDAVAAMTGHDPAADVRGYRDERSALRVVQRLGGLRVIGASRFGAEISPLQAQVGDVGLVLSTGGRESLALCGGAMWLGPGEQGLERLPLDAAVACWRCV